MKHQLQYKITVLLTCIMALPVSVMSGSVIAAEVYRWTDENGIVHYGDLPPQGQKAQTIKLQEAYRPGTTGSYPGSSGTQAVSQGDEADAQNVPEGQEALPQSAAEARREKIARDRKERRLAKAEMDRKCATQRQRLAMVEPSTRVIYRDENGEAVRMDNEVRIAQIEESKAFIAKNCD